MKKVKKFQFQIQLNERLNTQYQINDPMSCICWERKETDKFSLKLSKNGYFKIFHRDAYRHRRQAQRHFRLNNTQYEHFCRITSCTYDYIRGTRTVDLNLH